MNARFHCMFWKPDGVCSGIYCDATEKSQPIKTWKDSLSHKGTNTGEDQLLPCQWSWRTTCPVKKVVLTVLKLSKTLKTWKRSQNRGISGGFYAQKYKRQPRRCSLTTMMRNDDKSSPKYPAARCRINGNGSNIFYDTGVDLEIINII